MIARKFHIYKYENPFSPEYSSDSAITALAFNESRLELFVGGCNFTLYFDSSIYENMGCKNREAGAIVY